MLSDRVPKFVCSACGTPMSPEAEVIVKHINEKCYKADLWSCPNTCNSFIYIKESTDCGNRVFKFKGSGVFSVVYDLDTIAWI